MRVDCCSRRSRFHLATLAVRVQMGSGLVVIFEAPYDYHLDIESKVVPGKDLRLGTRLSM